MEILMQKAFAAIDEVFENTSLPQSETADSLRVLIEHCRELLNTLDVTDDD